MPDQREGVPEYKGWVTSGFTWINFIGTIMLRGGDLHELGDVEYEGQHSGRYDVDHHALVVGHGLKWSDLKNPIYRFKHLVKHKRI